MKFTFKRPEGPPPWTCERWRVSLFGPPPGSTIIPLKSRPQWIGLLLIGIGAPFLGVVYFKGLAPGITVDRLPEIAFCVPFFVAGGFLAALGLAALYVGESAWISGKRLHRSFRIWPLRAIQEFDLARIEELRPGRPGVGPTEYSLYFSYRGRQIAFGTHMRQADVNAAYDALRPHIGIAPPAPDPEPPPSLPVPEGPRPTWRSFSTLTLIAANLAALGGLLGYGWTLGQLMLLYWAESAVIALYNVLKLGKKTGPLVAFLGPLFLCFFGMYMAVHFFVLYLAFGSHAMVDNLDTGLIAALIDAFGPLWPSLLAFGVSHGISFKVNFLGRREFQRLDLEDLMSDPFRRILVMQGGMIVAGLVVLAAKSPVPALVVLTLLKTVLDVRAHVNEHNRTPRKPGQRSLW
ncbi:MAG TPA: DUF6498-containing protein, partial [Planctomycetota bacterium]|nr:DUF6498-containing protein [Planctomycetota bacterium]